MYFESLKSDRHNKSILVLRRLSDLFKSHNGFISLEVISDYQLIITSDDERLRQEVLAIVTKHNLPLVSVKNVGASLEEIFQKLTTEEGEEGS